MRRARAVKPASLVPLLLILLTLALSYDYVSSLITIILAAIAGAVLARLTLILVRHRRIAAPAVAVVPGGLDHASGSRRRQRIVPTELPPPPGILEGRDREIEDMSEYLSRPNPGDGPRVIVIHGEPGVGKTALAVRMAHLVADDYPDGQLLLRFDGSEEMLAEDRLAMFVQALKGPRDDLPDPAGRGRWYRDRTQRKRVLVILDNIGEADQIEPLLPAGPRCLAIVTSREPMPRLKSQFRISLAPLEKAAATALLDSLVGGRRAVVEREYAAEIVNASAGYPVAIHMAGAVLAVRKNWTLEIAVRRMREIAPDRRPGHPVAFTGILDLAFALLTKEERNALILLGLIDARRVEPWMLAALVTGASADRTFQQNVAGRLLDRLARACFTERQVDDSSGFLTFRVPVYVHKYARSRLDGYLTAEQQAAARLEFSDERRRRGERSAEEFLRDTVFRYLDEGRLDEALDTARESLALCREHAAALPTEDTGALTLAAEEGLTLAALGEVYAELGWIDDGMTCAESARNRGGLSPHTLPRALRVMGGLEQRQRQVQDAERDLRDALDAVGKIEDQLEHIRVLRELTTLQALRRDLRQGTEFATTARLLCERGGASGARQLPAVLLAHGKVLQACGRYREARDVLAEAEQLTADPNSRQQLARPWIRLQRALVFLDMDKYDQSRELSFAALEGFTTLRHRYGGAHARLALGRAHLAEGNVAKATPELEECHRTFQRCGDRWIAADAATALADAYHRAERGEEAVGLLSSARQAFAKLGDVRGTRRVSHLLRLVKFSLPGEPISGRPGVDAGLLAPDRPATTLAAP
jgi:tetratricopeptide (TPR) repeat protein